MIKTRTWAAVAAGIACIGLIVAVSARGQGQVSPALEGTWRVEVIQANGPPASAYHTYSQGGAMVESNSLGPTVGHGVWQRIGGRTFAFTFEKFNLDQNLPFRKIRVREVIEMDPDFQAYTGRGQILLFDAAGNQIGADCARTRAIRMMVEASQCP